MANFSSSYPSLILILNMSIDVESAKSPDAKEASPVPAYVSFVDCCFQK